jgi:hypothetical protein
VPDVERLIVLVVVLLVTAAISAWWRARDGRVIGAPLAGTRLVGIPDVGAPVTASGTGSRWAGLPVEAADVAAAVRPTTPLTLVEFTAPDCQPCTRTRELLDEVTAGRDDVRVHALDVGDVLDLARAHRILRAPTTLLISEEGHLLGRVGGVPRRDQLVALLDRTAEVAA